MVHRRAGQSADCVQRAANQGDPDVAAAIATYAAWLGFLVENFEPIGCGWSGHHLVPRCGVPRTGHIRRAHGRRPHRLSRSSAAPWPPGTGPSCLPAPRCGRCLSAVLVVGLLGEDGDQADCEGEVEQCGQC